MQKDIFEKTISFLLGASWAILLFGAIFTFFSLSFLGIITASFLTILYLFITLFMILALDAFHINRERLAEAKKQSELLEKIYANQLK